MSIAICIGDLTCRECGHINHNPQMMDVSDDDTHGSLIWCEKCQAWRRWEGGV